VKSLDTHLQKEEESINAESGGDSKHFELKN
jgi:hypothetical protein